MILYLALMLLAIAISIVIGHEKDKSVVAHLREEQRELEQLKAVQQFDKF